MRISAKIHYLHRLGILYRRRHDIALRQYQLAIGKREKAARMLEHCHAVLMESKADLENHRLWYSTLPSEKVVCLLLIQERREKALQEKFHKDEKTYSDHLQALEEIVEELAEVRRTLIRADIRLETVRKRIGFLEKVRQRHEVRRQDEQFLTGYVARHRQGVST